MFRNYLYYDPEFANRLYYAKGREKKKLMRELLREIPINGEGVPEKIGRKTKRRITVACVGGIMILVLAMAMDICDGTNFGGDALFAALFLLLMLTAVVSISCSLSIIGLRKKLAKTLLAYYCPVGEEYGENTLAIIGSLCRRTLFSSKYIESAAEAMKGELRGGMVTKCSCLACGKLLDAEDIKEYDHEAALCPVCGEKAILGRAYCMSDDFCETVFDYCRTVREIEKNKIYN